ncbi:MAG: Ig-like domain-containing protein, partial [Thermoplasmata archaeon]
GDLTEGALDTARIGFDTDHDGLKTEGREDEFVHGGQAPNGQGHYVIGSEDWGLEHTLYDLDPAKDPGIESAWGFGPTDRNPLAHRVYEFAISLSLLGLAPGEAIGFLAGGHSPSPSFGPGLWDSTSGGFSSWPIGRRSGMFLSEYAALTLADTRPSIAISTPVDAGWHASDGLIVAWSASDIGTGIDRFIAQLDDRVPVELGPSVRSQVFRGLDEGPHRVDVTAFDMAGHSRMDTANFAVDTVPPTVSIPIAARHNIFQVRDLIVFFTAKDETSGIDRIEVSLDGGPGELLPPTALGHVLKGLNDGAHTITVTATDNAGNSQSASAEFTVDTNLFSLTGPYGPIPLVGTLLTVGGSLVILFLLLRRRRGSR